MGNCCAKKAGTAQEVEEEVPTLTPLVKGSVLWIAQQMTETKNGKRISQHIQRKAMSDAEVLKWKNDPEISSDMRLILNPPFSVLNKLTKYVYLSGVGSLTTENLEKMKINLIINATYEWPKIQPIINGKEVMCIRVPVDDSGQDDISIYFEEVSNKIEENARKGGHTLVHCMAGASRSTSIVLAYLMKYENISLLNAFKSVKKRRETGRPNIGFWVQLVKFEIRSRGKATVKIEKYIEEGFEVTAPDVYKTFFPDLYKWEVRKQVEEAKQKMANPTVKTKAEKCYNPDTKTYE